MGAYIKLLSMRYHHQYYTDSVCRDLITAPTERCQQLMRNHKLVFKSLENGFDMFYLAEGETSDPLVPFDPETELRFDVTMRNPEFYTYTVLDESLLKTHRLEYTNGDTDGDLFGELVDISQESRKNSVIAQLAFSDLDLLMQEEGFELNYTLNFDSTESKWTYYLVLPADSAIPNYILQDEDPVAASTRYGLLSFDAPLTVTLSNGATALKVVSTSPISSMQESKPKIQLYDTVEEEVVIDNLPNPKTNQANFEVYINV